MLTGDTTQGTEGTTDMDVFDVFKSVPYTFLQISRGGEGGNTIVSQTSSTGVFKLRSQFVRGDNSETIDSNASLHIRPSETFITTNEQNLVGHGILVNNNTYEIISFTGGMNFDTGLMEHYTAVLQETEFSDYEGSSS